MEPKKLNKKYVMLQVVLIIGMLISLFLVYEHFAPSTSEFCKFGEGFDCGIVNKSPYANADGVFYLFSIDFGWPTPYYDISGINVFFDFMTSNATMGFVVLLFLFLLMLSWNKNKKFLWIEDGKQIYWARGILIFGVLYGFYLFLIQHLILQTYCIFCLLLDATLISSLILVFLIKNGKRE